MADAPEPSKPEKLKRGVLEWFSGHPLIGFISFIVGIVSLIATIYFGFATLTSRDLSLTVNPTKTTIVKAGQISDLHVLYKGQSVATDVTALQVEIWNAGKESIRPEHVLSPITLQTSPRVSILEVRLRYTSRPVCDIALDESELAEGKVGVSWKILEHNDGAIIQFIVAGPSNVTVMAQGSVEGDSAVRLVTAKAPFWKAGGIEVCLALAFWMWMTSDLIRKDGFGRNVFTFVWLLVTGWLILALAANVPAFMSSTPPPLN
jgi:hypothetical protein